MLAFIQTDYAAPYTNKLIFVETCLASLICFKTKTSNLVWYYGTKEAAVYKRRPQSRRKGSVQCGHFSDKMGSSEVDVLTLWCKNNFGFFEIFGVSARTRGVELVRRRRKVLIFLFCGRLMDSP